MPLLPRSEYRDLFFTRNFGPYNADDFGVSPGLSSVSLSTDTNSSQSSVSSSDVTSVQGALVAGEGGIEVFCPDKDVWIDHVWIRAGVVSSVDSVRFRLLIVRNGQSTAQAYLNDQWLTRYQNIGDSSSISSDPEDEGIDGQPLAAAQPLVADTMTELKIRTLNFQPYNKVPAGGVLIASVTANPTALERLVIGIRGRERGM